MKNRCRVCHIFYVMYVVKETRSSMREKNRESTWLTCCVLLSELVLILQLIKPPLIYVLRGHDSRKE